MDNIKEFDVMILSGGFDPPHRGHIKMFKQAKELATVVIVGLNSDEWLTRKKGKPFMNFGERSEILSSIKFIDNVWGFNDDDGTACNLISNVHSLCADILFTALKRPVKIAFGNGGDRSKKGSIPSSEEELCQKLGIDIVGGVGGEEKVQSSSTLIANAKKEQYVKP